MNSTEKNEPEMIENFAFQQKILHRRAFLRYSGYAGAAVAATSLLTLGACIT